MQIARQQAAEQDRRLFAAPQVECLVECLHGSFAAGQDPFAGIVLQLGPLDLGAYGPPLTLAQAAAEELEVGNIFVMVARTFNVALITARNVQGLELKNIKAHATPMGLTGLFINRKGRERSGIVVIDASNADRHRQNIEQLDA